MSPAPAAPSAPVVLDPAAWGERARAHAERALTLTVAARERRARGEKHAVEDFLYDYYALRPGHLDRWEPGLGVALARPDAAAGPVGGGERGAHEESSGEADPLTRWEAIAARRWYRVVETPAGPAATLDLDAYLADRGAGVRAMDTILRATASREPHLGCLGLHEWAMVYRQESHRHPLPLRLGQEGTDTVVDAATIRCTHYDAYRFFTPEAAPLNRLRPTRATQEQFEQPGCLHATMDLLRWSLKLGPLVPGELLLDCFALARDVRVLDMEASPYDCRDLGYGVVAIETAPGRAEYIARQQVFTERAAPLRARLLTLTGSVHIGGIGP